MPGASQCPAGSTRGEKHVISRFMFERSVRLKEEKTVSAFLLLCSCSPNLAQEEIVRADKGGGGGGTRNSGVSGYATA